MEESILEQSKKARRLGGRGKRKKLIVILLILGLAAYYGYDNYVKDGSKAGIMMSQQKSATVSRGDIQLAVETDGTVTAEDGVELSFSTTGETVEAIFVSEGDTVKQGDKIASISTTSMQYELQNAQDGYQAAVLALSDARAGATEKEIKNAQYQIEQAEANLTSAWTSLEQTKIDNAEQVKDAQDAIVKAQENLKLNTSTSSSKIVDDAYGAVYTDAENLSLTLKSHLYSADKILGADDMSLNDGFENVLGVTNTTTRSAAESSYNRLKVEKQKLDALLTSTSKTDQAGVDQLAQGAQAALSADKQLYTDLVALMDATITCTGFTQSELDSLKSSTTSTRTSINSSIAALDKDIDAIDTAKDSLSDLKTAYDKAVSSLSDVERQNVLDITNAETSIRNKEIALDQAKMNYAELVAPLTTAELQNLTTKVNQTRNNLREIQDKIDEATLTSPIDGQVGNINGKVGSLISENSTEAFATIINKDTLFVKVDVEESDISQIKKGQKAYVTFDAIDDLKLEGEVTYISMTAASNNSGVVTYEVRVVLKDVGKTEVKEGMTAFVQFVSDEVKDVLQVPVAAVVNVNGTASVKLAGGSYQEVVTGFTDGSVVEIVSGLRQGDKIVY